MVQEAQPSGSPAFKKLSFQEAIFLKDKVSKAQSLSQQVFIHRSTTTLHNRAANNLNLQQNISLQLNYALKPRPIILDGMNIAFRYGEHLTGYNFRGNGKLVAFEGVYKAISYFNYHLPPHFEIKVVLPAKNTLYSGIYNLANNTQDILSQIDGIKPKYDSILYYSTYRQAVAGQHVHNHDDHNIFEITKILPDYNNAVIVSGDHFQDAYNQAKMSHDFHVMNLIEKNVCNFNFLRGQFCLPADPLARNYKFEIINGRREIVPVNKNEGIPFHKKITREFFLLH